MKKFIFGLMLSLMFPLFVMAESFVIDHYKIDMMINDDGSLGITETIDVQFSEPKHGIERLLPQRYTYDDTHDEIVDYRHVTTNVTQSSYNEGANLVLRLGDADRTVDGSQQYIISYTANPGVKQYSGRQELYRNLIGTEWGVPIHKAIFHITAPDHIDLTQLGSGDIQAVIGVEGSEYHIPLNITNTNTIQGSTTNLGINEGITLGIKFRDHSFHPSSPRIIDKTIDSSCTIYTGTSMQYICTILYSIKYFITKNIDVIIILIIYGSILIIILYQTIMSIIPRFQNQRYKIRARQGVVIQYSPPVNVLPHEGALILDDGFEDRHFVATLYDWYYRGVISINNTDSDNIILHIKNKNLITGSKFEEGLVKGIFGGKDNCNINKLANGSFMIDRYYNTKSVTNFYRKGIITDQGVELYRYIIGYKEFIKTVESNQLIEYLKQDPHYINKLIPWAIALGLDTVIKHTLTPLIEAGLIPDNLLSQQGNIRSNIRSVTSTQIAKRTAAAARAARLSYNTRSSFGSSGSSRSSSGGGRGGGGGRSR